MYLFQSGSLCWQLVMVDEKKTFFCIFLLYIFTFLLDKCNIFVVMAAV